MSAIRAETGQVEAELRRQATAAFSGNARGIANAWRSVVFPRSGQSLRPAGLVFTKVAKIIDAFERGALIRAKGGASSSPSRPASMQRVGGGGVARRACG